MDSKKLHVVVFPWLGHGHISPLLALSKRLAMDDALRVSFVSTPGNISKIRRLVETEQGHIDLVELPLPSVEGLPDGAENTADVPTEIIPLQIKAVDMWEKPFEMLMRKLCPHCVIHDFIQWWTPKVAANLNIPSVVFMMTSGASVAYSARAGGDNVNAEDLMKSPPGYPQSAVRCRLFEALYRLSSYRPKYTTDQIRFMDRFLASFEGSCAIAINSCSQLEGKYLEYLERFTGKPVFPVGPMLVQPPKQKQTTAVLETETPHCLQWLDDRAPRSVVYVSMGSECFSSPAQIHALALGLEASHVPFLWALRFTHNNDNDDVGKRMSAVLPEGFEGRTRDRGVVIGGWAPQKEILGHPSIGAYLSHCGWNSVMEAMRWGVAMICLPMQYDQGLIARLLADELKVGVEIARDEEDGTFSDEDVCRAVKAVMGREEGREARANAAKFSTILGSNEFQATNLANFIDHLKRKASSNA